MFEIIIIIFVAVASGLVTMERGRVHATSPNVQATQSVATGQSFMAYRTAVVRYSENNGGFRGAVPVAGLNWPAGLTAKTAPRGAANEIIAGPNGSRIVCAWAKARSGTAARLAGAYAGDETIGVSNGVDWSTPAGGVMGPLPVSVPAGDIVSVVKLGS